MWRLVVAGPGWPGNSGGHFTSAGLGWNVLAAAHTNIIPPDTSGKAATGIISKGTNKRQKTFSHLFLSQYKINISYKNNNFEFIHNLNTLNCLKSKRSNIRREF